MSGPSSSQEIELEYVTYCPSDSLPVLILRRVQEGIHQEVSETFATAPHRGVETGGILLGRREEDRIVVEDFEPVPSEHQFGPSYRLSDADRALLRETLDWFRGGAQPGLSVLGFYRSHTLADFGVCEEDEELMRTHFAEGEDLVLPVRPSLMGSSAEDFFLRSAAPPAPPPAPQPIVEGTPTDEPAPPHPPADIAGIRALLDRWASALKRGDVQAAALCYAPVVTTYFQRHDVTREAVRQSIKQARARYGRLDIYRISGLGITPVSDSRAVATFRKHWQTSGRGKTAGEEEERMTLVRKDGAWQISSEQTESR